MGLFGHNGFLSKLSKGDKDAWGEALAPVTGGTSLLLTDEAQEMWDDYTGKTAVEEANKANALEAQKNRDWQEYMSNTAMTRQMQDLMNAGINPNAAASLGGASTPGGAQATMQAEPSNAQAALGLAQTAASVAGGMSDIATATKTMTENKYLPASTKSQISNVNASTALTNAQAQKTNAETQNIQAKTDMIKAEYTIMAQEDKIRQATYYSRYMAAINAGANEQKIQEITNEWLNTEFGQKAKKAGLTLGEVGQILGPAMQGYGIYQNGKNTYQKGFAAGYASN